MAGIEAIMRGDVRTETHEERVIPVEESLAEGDRHGEEHVKRERWWKGLLGQREGRIKLPEEGEAG